MFTEISLRNKTVKQLRALATARGLTVNSTTRKDPFIHAILAHQSNQNRQEEQKDEDTSQHNQNNSRRVTFQDNTQPMDVDLGNHPVIQRLDGQLLCIQNMLQQFQAPTQQPQQ